MMIENEDLTEEKEEEENDELFEHYSITVDAGQSAERIDKFIANKAAHLSRNKIQNASKANCLLVNKVPVKSNYKVRPHDVISIVLPRERRTFDLTPENLNLAILYEDDDVLVVNKPAGMVVHPGTGNWDGTLANGLAYHIKDYQDRGLDAMRPGIVHRIDKFTSGLLVVGKTELAISHLSKQFFDKTVDRIYEALVWGSFEEQAGTIDTNIARSQKDRKIFQAYEDELIGKTAITHYKVLEDFGYTSLVQCQLETGRTHQIRVHMKSVGHPIFADKDYGGDKIVKGTVFTKYRQFVENCFKLCKRQALHAKTLGFTHPKTGERLNFEAPLPDDMKSVIEKWKKYALQLKR